MRKIIPCAEQGSRICRLPLEVSASVFFLEGFFGLVPFLSCEGIESQAYRAYYEQRGGRRHPCDEHALLCPFALHSGGERRVVAERLCYEQECGVCKADCGLCYQAVDSRVHTLAAQSADALVVVDNIAVHQRNEVHSARKAHAGSEEPENGNNAYLAEYRHCRRAAGEYQAHDEYAFFDAPCPDLSRPQNNSEHRAKPQRAVGYRHRQVKFVKIVYNALHKYRLNEHNREREHLKNDKRAVPEAVYNCLENVFVPVALCCDLFFVEEGRRKYYNEREYAYSRHYQLEFCRVAADLRLYQRENYERNGHGDKREEYLPKEDAAARLIRYRHGVRHDIERGCCRRSGAFHVHNP